MTTTTTKTTARALPWLRYSADVDAQIAAHTTPEEIEAVTRVLMSAPATVTTRPQPKPVAVAVATVNGASEKQAKFIDNLLGEKVHSYTEAEVIEAKADWRKTRKMIDTLIAAPRRPYQAPVPVEAPVAQPSARLDFSAILDGNYAIRVDGVVKFYRVSTSKKGFKNVQVRASDELYMQFGKAGIAILHRIVEAGLEESRMLFAAELERCWKCGRSLTDETSRAIGMGPDCASK